MKRKYLVAGGMVAVVAVAGLTWQLTTGQANSSSTNTKGADGPGLPIAQVVLFNSGVGYFQREGDVNGECHGQTIA